MLASLVKSSIDDEVEQPQEVNIKCALLLCLGKVLLYRGYRQATSRDVHNITAAEFKAVGESLHTYGRVVTMRLRRQSKDSVIFIKNQPAEIQDFVSEFCSFEEYTEKFDCPLHPTVTENVKSALQSNGHVSRAFFN